MPPPAPPAAATFADVPPGYWAAAAIERSYAHGLTTGGGPDDQGRRLYCPDRAVTRAEMAVFLERTLGHAVLGSRARGDPPLRIWHPPVEYRGNNE